MQHQKVLTWADFKKRFPVIVPVVKGWSGDKKYQVTGADGISYLLRISPPERYEARRALFEVLQSVAALGIPMCRAVEMGLCEEGVYVLHTWIPGGDLREGLHLYSRQQQYDLGHQAGQILKRIHAIPAPPGQEDWQQRFNRKIDRKIKDYLACGLRYPGDEALLAYLAENRHLLAGRPQCFQHGDYHEGNMMLSGGQLIIIDFDRFDYGDPYEEFNRIVWSAALSPAFATGQVRGYFQGEPPHLFWQLLALYIASNTLGALPWAIPFGQKEIDVMKNQAQQVLRWYDGMKNPLPSWYQPGIIQASENKQ